MSGSSLIAVALILPFVGALLVALAGRAAVLRDALVMIVPLALLGVVAQLPALVLDGRTASLLLVEMMPGLSLRLEAEPLGVLFACVAALLWPIASLYSIGYLRGNREKHQTRFHACFALAIGGTMGVALAGNLLTLFVAYELLTLSTYPLVAHKGNDHAIAGARTYLGILPAHILADTPWEELEMNPYMDAPTVTSGPYDFVEFVPEQYIHKVKKEDYWGKEVTIDEVYVKLFESTATQLAQLEAGELDLAQVPPDEMDRFELVEHVDTLAAQGIGYYVTHMDFRNEEQIAQLNLPADDGGKGYSISKEPKPYLQDKRFRQALAYAVDDNAIMQVVAGGQATPI